MLCFALITWWSVEHLWWLWIEYMIGDEWSGAFIGRKVTSENTKIIRKYLKTLKQMCFYLIFHWVHTNAHALSCMTCIHTEGHDVKVCWSCHSFLAKRIFSSQTDFVIAFESFWIASLWIKKQPNPKSMYFMVDLM